MNKRITELRKMLGYSQGRFATELGVTRTFISLVENGVRGLSSRTIDDICEKFNVNKEWLVNGEGEPRSPVSRKQQIAELTARYFHMDEDSVEFELGMALERLLVSLTPEQIEIITDAAVRLAKKNKEP